jgi:hypothetical protein
MKQLNYLLSFIRRNKFMDELANIKSNGGISALLNGYGTNKNDQRTGPSKEHFIKIKAGLLKLKAMIDEAITFLNKAIKEL